MAQQMHPHSIPEAALSDVVPSSGPERSELDVCDVSSVKSDTSIDRSQSKVSLESGVVNSAMSSTSSPIPVGKDYTNATRRHISIN